MSQNRHSLSLFEFLVNSDVSRLALLHGDNRQPQEDAKLA